MVRIVIPWLCFVFVATAQELTQPDTSGLGWRSLGPANMEGRVTAIAVVEGKPSTFFVAAATGGLWRTKNAGTTFEPVFESGGTASMGSVAVAPSDPKVVWIGTGEGNARNSVTYGDGVYKSCDGGDSFVKMGLEATRHVPRVVIHPKDPDTVYFATLGRIFGPNAERGLWKTRDGGQTFEHILKLNDNTGVVDVALAPDNPEVVYCASYEVRRDGFDTNDPAVKFGSEAGIWKSTDGGANWKRLGGGLPTVKCGRIGLAVQGKNPNSLWAVIETELTGLTPPAPEVPEENAPAWMGVTIDEVEKGGVLIQGVSAKGPAQLAGIKADDVLESMDGEPLADQAAFHNALKARKPGAKVRVGIRRQDTKLELEVGVIARPPQKATGDLGGQLENRQDQQGPTGYQCGGVFRSDDGGDTWRRLNSVNPRPFYYSQIRVDPEDDKRLWVLGTSLYYSEDGGATFKSDGARRVHVDHHALWIDPADPRHMLLGNDGGLCITWDRGRQWEFESLLPIGQFYALALDQRQPYRIYGGLQDNGSWGIPSRTRSGGVRTDSVYRVGGGDGFVCAVDPEDDDTIYCESQNGNLQRVNVRTGETSAVRRPRMPGAPAEPTTEAQPTPRASESSAEGGREQEQSSGRWRFNWKTPFLLSPWNHATLMWAGQFVMRSPDRGQSAQVISPDITRSSRGSATALAESAVQQGLYWVGSDDGAVHVTQDGGAHWTAVHGNLPCKEPRWVAHIEVSRRIAGKAWVILDGHRSDDFGPHVYVTEDFGATFKSLHEGLPQASTRVLREDPKNPRLLYLGTETGVYFSCDDGAHWTRLGKGLPTVPVHDLAIHPRERELVAATHGRALWMTDVSALQDWRAGDESKDLVVYVPKSGVLWNAGVDNGRMGARRYRAEGPERGVAIWFSSAPAAGKVQAKISAANGDVVYETSSELSGLQRVLWTPAREGRVKPGNYRVTIETKESSVDAPLTLTADPSSLRPEEVILP
jgi:photosystem II stability/assembly factor-like uncharacterized protein